jgi:hypothetical protein
MPQYYLSGQLDIFNSWESWRVRPETIDLLNINQVI